MKKKILNWILMTVGAIGAVVLSIVAIADSQAGDLLSVLPATMVFCTMFASGYISHSKED